MQRCAAITECSGPVSLTVEIYGYGDRPPNAVLCAHAPGSMPEYGKRLEIFRHVGDMDALALVFDQSGHYRRASVMRAAALSMLAAIDVYNESVAVDQVERVLADLAARDAEECSA